MMMEKYSVLMSLYAKEKPEYLSQAIDSMLGQTVMPNEIVIVKDGLLPPMLEDILSQYKMKYPDIFNIVPSDTNLGLGLALNLGLQHCRNELVARMDTDDISKLERCEMQLKYYTDHPSLALLGTYVDEFNGNPENIISTRCVPTESKDIYEYAKRRSAFNHPTVMYRKSAVLAQGGYGDLKRNQDVDLFGRMLFAGCEAANIGEALLWFRSNDALAKRRKSWENTKSYIDTIQKFWKMGYSGFGDYLLIAVAQTMMFICPIEVQNWLYKMFLRK